MTHCPLCGRPAPSAGAFSLCGECHEQIVSLCPGDPRYFWYMRAVRAVLRSGKNRQCRRSCP